VVEAKHVVRSGRFPRQSRLEAGRYVVLNSGHTFGEKELASLNDLPFPRLGAWAVLKRPYRESVSAGFFDEQWRFAARPAR
jgi:hypothetical protein